MEDKGKNCVSGQPSSFLSSRPPISSKSFTTIPSSSREIGWQHMQLYSTNHDKTDRSQTQFHLESFNGTTRPAPMDFVPKDQKPQIPSQLPRNPIKSITPSSDNHDGFTVKTELGIDYEMKCGRNMDPNVDDKRFRRILSNRISAQKSRTRKLQYVNDMERKKKDLEVEIAKLAPLVENEQEKLKRMQMENHFLKERMSVCEDRAKLSLALVEENRAVIRRLKELYAAQQNMYSMQAEEEYYRKSTTRATDHDQRMRIMMMGDYSNSSKPMAEDQALNFNSLTIDPPSSLHHDDDDVKY